MSFVILDLEWNTAFSKSHNKYINEIIEFGAIKLDNKLKVIDSFAMLVKPSFAKNLCHHIKDIVDIDFLQLEQSRYTFAEVLDKFADFLGDDVLLTWSTSDLHALIDNSAIHLLDENMPFIAKYCDLQHYCEYSLGVSSGSRMLGLNACAQMLGIVSDDSLQSHRALDDAHLSAKCFKALFNRRYFEEFVEICDEEFYRKLTFKQKYITNISNPVLDQTQMYFDCPECGVRCIRKSKWNVQKKAFVAVFVCPDCKKEFKGRVFAKLKYEGVVISKKLIPKKEVEDNQKTDLS